MERLLTWALVVYGISFIITGAKIFRPVRRLLGPVDASRPDVIDAHRRVEVKNPVRRFFADLIYCPVCTGFWVGLCLSLGGLRIVEGIALLPRFSGAVLNGAAASAVCWILHVVLVRVGALEL